MQGCVQQGIEVPQEMIQPRDYGIQEQHLNSQKTRGQTREQNTEGRKLPWELGPWKEGLGEKVG